MAIKVIEPFFGNFAFNSETCRGMYNSTLTETSSSSNVSLTETIALDDSHGIATPYGRTTVEQDVTNRGTVFTTSGSVASDGTIYKPPSITWNFDSIDQNDYHADLTVNAGDTAAQIFGSRNSAVNSSDVYGIRCKHPNGTINIDPSVAQYKVMPASNGAIERSDIALSIPTNLSYLTTDDYLFDSDDITMNVDFDQEFDRPPLIFVNRIFYNQTPDANDTLSISLLGFVKNVSGKYIGAKVVAVPSYGTQTGFEIATTGSTYSDTYYYLSNSLTFHYVLVSDEEPDYPNLYTNPSGESYGIKLFNSAGDLTFSSEYWTTDMYLDANVNRPEAYLKQISGGGLSFEISNRRLMEDAYQTTSYTGVLLNNCNACSGFLYRQKYRFTGSDESFGVGHMVGRTLRSMTPANVLSIFGETVSFNTMVISSAVVASFNCRRFDGGFNDPDYSTIGQYNRLGSWAFHRDNATMVALYGKYFSF